MYVGSLPSPSNHISRSVLTWPEVAAFTTVLLVLSESATIVSLLSRSFLLHEALVDVFDGTLLTKNENAMVAEGRELKAGGDPIAKLGKLIKK